MAKSITERPRANAHRSPYDNPYAAERSRASWVDNGICYTLFKVLAEVAMGLLTIFHGDKVKELLEATFLVVKS